MVDGRTAEERWRLAMVAILYSGTIEFTQLFIPDRSADVDDVIVNVAGAMLGYLVYVLVLRPREGRPAP